MNLFGIFFFKTNKYVDFSKNSYSWINKGGIFGISLSLEYRILKPGFYFFKDQKIKNHESLSNFFKGQNSWI